MRSYYYNSVQRSKGITMQDENGRYDVGRLKKHQCSSYKDALESTVIGKLIFYHINDDRPTGGDGGGATIEKFIFECDTGGFLSLIYIDNHDDIDANLSGGSMLEGDKKRLAYVLSVAKWKETLMDAITTFFVTNDRMISQLKEHGYVFAKSSSIKHEVGDLNTGTEKDDAQTDDNIKWIHGKSLSDISTMLMDIFEGAKNKPLYSTSQLNDALSILTSKINKLYDTKIYFEKYYNFTTWGLVWNKNIVLCLSHVKNIIKMRIKGKTEQDDATYVILRLILDFCFSLLQDFPSGYDTKLKQLGCHLNTHKPDGARIIKVKTNVTSYVTDM